MKLVTITAFIAAAILMSSCSEGSSTARYAATTDSTKIDSDADSINTEVPSLIVNKEIQRKLIKTINYNFKVPNVEKTAYEIDNIVKQLKGYTSSSLLKSDILNTQKFPYTKDSLVEISSYNASNTLTIYIPSEMLDSAMQLVQQKISFLNSREVTVEDVSLKMLQNQMDIVSNNKFNEKMQVHADNDSHKLNQVQAVQQNILENDTKGNATVVENIDMNDHVKYSQVNIILSQNTMVAKTIIPNIDIESLYKPSFFSRMKDAIENGFDTCLDFIVAITNVWFVFVLMFFVWVIIRKRKALLGWIK
jgi:hypothetical protein